MSPQSSQADVELSGLGDSVVSLIPCTQAGREWIDDNLQAESWQWLGGALCIDHRFVEMIVGGMRADGLTVDAPEARS